ncbi:type IV toxin-antitoxin system AbiEi family antitoxin domain-containing protein [Curtobacterium sp. VKM Ac-2884]|uniref:type IV toxin-antitoxin system AbiEi family antitoxin domain-containing protein n=1 Tax=Curtobacterium sp. VKM Ac-2884 TaxID=2783818 RepID=UPI00188A6407|nr:type IV toxin-antitoxin system AbiEi family antitoxin domain-containing protein [Curtobacterium sp. VKM Ac-2884]MBF4604044.1 type IV toxin-antitoxin system AbiEi family antitoxin domain-containing protein [Curtobacterium sp. VKM Ac-2884]
MSASTESKLAGLAAGQWGMLTAAQATEAGVARSTLLRREQTGALERMRHGVYRLPGAPVDPADDIRAAWLASDPSTIGRDRLDDPDVTVGGAAAAAVHGIGDLSPAPYLLYTSTRRRTRHDDVRYSTRPVPAEDVMILDGLPVTTRERTIADLLDEPGADISTVADALRDAELSGADVDVQSLIEHLDPMAKGLGLDDGAALYQRLRSLTQVDEVRLRDLIAHTDIVEQVDAAVETHLREALEAVTAQIDRQTRTVIEPVLRSEAVETPTAQSGRPSRIGVPKVALPPGLLPKTTLPPSTLALIDQIAQKSTRPSGARRDGTSNPTTQPEETDER